MNEYQTKRQHPRYNVDIQVGVKVAQESFDARTRDISRAGLCLVAGSRSSARPRSSSSWC